jgi:23S rRNA A1618 N6-methylase RlmF
MDRQERMIENEKLFREVNERVADIEANFSGPDPEWVCECGDGTCFEKVAVPIEEYQQIRAHGDWFLITPGHEKADIERIVRQNGEFVVVEKFEL